MDLLMSSQYYSATAYVGTPHRNEVEVTIPLVGPAGPQGPAGEGGGGDLTSPGPIGSVAPNTGAFTTLSATGTATLPHIHGSLAGNLYIHVKNTSGGQLTRGTPVYIVGNVGDTDRVEVAAADFDDATKMPAVGLLEQTLANNGSGDAIILGELDEANTNAYTINTELYVGNNGALTSTRPTTGQVQSVGAVARVNSNTGVIVVNMQGRRSPNEAFAQASHTHAASDITSGVLNYARQATIDLVPIDGDDVTIYAEDYTQNGNLIAHLRLRPDIADGVATVVLPTLTDTSVGEITLRVISGQQFNGIFIEVFDEEAEQIFGNINGPNELDADEEITFRWNNGRWDMDLRPNPFATTAAVSIFKPNASGTLALNPMTTAGDIVVGGTSGTPARLALGTAAQQLRVNSGATSLEYFTPAAAFDPASPGAIGGTTPAAGTFTTLTANTSLTLNGTGAAELINAGAAAGPLRIYNTFTSATNFERLRLAWASNVAIIGTEKGSGGGTARDLVFQTDGVTRMTIQANGFSAAFTGRITSGIVQCPSIGTVADGNAGWVFGSTLAAGSSVTSVNLPSIVRYGGTTNLFPALKRDSTTLQVRLADDTAFAPLACGALTLNGNLDASTRDIVTDITTGTKIGTATTQKIGFFNATPVVQQAAVADATDAASTQARLNDLLARLRTLGLIAT
jgi:hypothetical protein